MIATAVQSSTPSVLEDLRARFLAVVLPKVERHARVYFSGDKCPARKADRVAETIALAWKWFVPLVQRGKDPSEFPTALASFAARAVRGGRRVCGQLKPKDVLSELAQLRHGFGVEKLPISTRTSHEDLQGLGGQRRLDAYEERLQDNRMTPVPEQAAFRIDFPAWLTTRTERDRRIIAEMGRNERTLDLSRKFGISPARVSQLRREYQRDWNRYTENLD